MTALNIRSSRTCVLSDTGLACGVYGITSRVSSTPPTDVNPRDFDSNDGKSPREEAREQGKVTVYTI